MTTDRQGSGDLGESRVCGISGSRRQIRGSQDTVGDADVGGVDVSGPLAGKREEACPLPSSPRHRVLKDVSQACLPRPESYH